MVGCGWERRAPDGLPTSPPRQTRVVASKKPGTGMDKIGSRHGRQNWEAWCVPTRRKTRTCAVLPLTRTASSVRYSCVHLATCWKDHCTFPSGCFWLSRQERRRGTTRTQNKSIEAHFRGRDEPPQNYPFPYSFFGVNVTEFTVSCGVIYVYMRRDLTVL